MRHGLQSICLVLLLTQSPAFSAEEAASEPGYDLFIQTPQRLLTIRFVISANGKPAPTAWTEFLDARFQDVDKDLDGKLTAEERRLMPTSEAYQLLGLRGQAARLSAATLLLQKRPPVAVSTRADFQRFLEDAGVLPFRLEILDFDFFIGRRVVSAPDEAPPDLDLAAKVLFEKLDRNADGAVSVAELEQAPNSLRKDDVDRDERISALELLAGAPLETQSGSMQAALSTQPTGGLADWFFCSPPAGGAFPTVTQLIAFYDGRNTTATTKDGRISRQEIGMSERAFSLHDKNRNGTFEVEELLAFVLNPLPDVVVKARLSNRKDAPKALDVRRVGKNGAAAEEVPGPVDLGRIQVVFETVALQLDNPTTALRDLFKKSDRDGSGHIERSESILMGHSHAVFFRHFDQDRDGRLSPGEYAQGLKPLATAVDRKFQVSVLKGGIDLFWNLTENGISFRDLRALAQAVPRWDQNGDRQISRDELPQTYRLYVSKVRMVAFNGLYMAPLISTAAADQAIARHAAQRAATGNNGPVWFQSMDRNDDGDVSRAEFLGGEERFKKLDTDQNGSINSIEANAAPAAGSE